jgi:hypothetical protein
VPVSSVRDHQTCHQTLRMVKVRRSERGAMMADDFNTALTVWFAAFRHASRPQESVISALTLSAMMASTTSRSIWPSSLKSMRTR